MDLSSVLNAWNDIGGSGDGVTPDNNVPTPSEVAGANLEHSSPSPSPFPTIVTAGGDFLSGFGSYLQGQETASADEYNANLALMQGQFEVEGITAQETEELATQRAMYAKSGVELTGSPMDVALQTATVYEYDKQVANFNAESAAAMDNYKASAAKSQGKFNLGMGLLKGAGALLPLAFA